jgi:hypothetical protein
MLDGVPDTRYYNVSMEAINFTPVNLDIIKQFVETRDA